MLIIVFAADLDHSPASFNAMFSTLTATSRQVRVEREREEKRETEHRT